MASFPVVVAFASFGSFPLGSASDIWRLSDDLNGKRLCAFLPSFETLLGPFSCSNVDFFLDMKEGWLGSTRADGGPLMEGVREICDDPAGIFLRLSTVGWGSALSFPRRRAKNRPGPLLVLGDCDCATECCVISEKVLGVGLAARGTKLVFEAKAEPRADCCGCIRPRVL